MWKWISKIFDDSSGKLTVNQIEFVQITKDWQADSVNPQVELKIDESNLEMQIYSSYVEGNKVKITFENCAEYSLNTCNDEGYFYGQYRIGHNRLPWGEFYEIVSGLDRKYPEPVIKIQEDKTNKRHFIFFFKDETFECLADEYRLEFYHEN